MTNKKDGKKRVAIYARVSTEHEAQLSAFENQIEWYNDILSKHPEWEVVKRYEDEGITGTSAKKRPQFMQMIQDADDGLFDLIITREISRFARNTKDALEYTRILKRKNVEVFFISDNLSILNNCDGELRLTIMSAIAQEESRKTSDRVKSGQKVSMNKGTLYGNGNILGYDRIEKIVEGNKRIVEFVINPEQAQTVRMIYDWYLGGLGLRKIKFKLEEAGRLTSTGKENWDESNISRILNNTFYHGIITYHKEFTPDYLEQKKIRNYGDIDFLAVESNHEKIVTKEEYDRVQEILSSKRKGLKNITFGTRREFGSKPCENVWTQLLKCECGHHFNRHKSHKSKEGIQYTYQCYSSIRSGTVKTRQKKGLSIDGICTSPAVPEWKLKMMANYVLKEFVTNKKSIISLAESMLEKHIDDKASNKQDNKRIIEKKKSEIKKFNEKINVLIEMRTDGDITKAVFKEKKEEYENLIIKIKHDIEELEPEDEKESISKEERMRVLRCYLQQSVDFENGSDIPDDVIKAFVEKIVVHDNSFDWYLRFSPDNPQSLIVKGDKKGSNPPFCCTQHRQLSKLRATNN